MPNTTSWREVRRRRPPNEYAVALEKMRLRLAMIREQRGMSQDAVAEILGTSQSNVSQLERSQDQMLSTVAKYVKALGGELELMARFGDTTYTLLDDAQALGAPQEVQERQVIKPTGGATKRQAAAAGARRPQSSPQNT
jgi:transcriptional regulator with XRE-family HTH domain